MPIETLNLCLYCWESNPRPRACQVGAPLRTNIPSQELFLLRVPIYTLGWVHRWKIKHPALLFKGFVVRSTIRVPYRKIKATKITMVPTTPSHQVSCHWFNFHGPMLSSYLYWKPCLYFQHINFLATCNIFVQL